MNSLMPAFNSGDIDRGILDFVNGAEDNMEWVLSYVGEQFVNWARSVDSYKDRTGNLRSSVGYIIAKDGNIINESFPGGKSEGVSEGRKIAEEVLQGDNGGYVLIVVAGMEYAAYVESKGFDVLSGSAPSAERLLKKLIKELELG